MSSTVEVARSPLPGNVEKYAGKWVAIRDGDVVAFADDFNDLIADERVQDRDALYHVPDRETAFY